MNRPESIQHAVTRLTNTVLEQQEIIERLTNLSSNVIAELAQHRSVDIEERLLNELTQS